MMCCPQQDSLAYFQSRNLTVALLTVALETATLTYGTSWWCSYSFRRSRGPVKSTLNGRILNIRTPDRLVVTHPGAFSMTALLPPLSTPLLEAE